MAVLEYGTDSRMTEGDLPGSLAALDQLPVADKQSFIVAAQQGSSIRAVAWRHWQVGLLLLVGGLVLAVYYVTVKGEHRSAINRWRPLVRELVAGNNVYRAAEFPTPPIMGLLLYPFYVLPGKWTMLTWFLAKIAMLLWTLWTLVAMAETSTSKLPPWTSVLALLLAAPPIVGDLLHGNVNSWILFLVVAAFGAFRAGRDGVTGILLGLAIACKVTPALLLLFFAGKGALRVVFTTLLATFAWLILVPASVLGWHENLHLFDQWATHMVWPFLWEGKVETEQVNQSIPGIWYRLFTTLNHGVRADGHTQFVVNFLKLDPAAARWGLRGIMLFLLMLLAYCCRDKNNHRMHLSWLVQFSLVLAWMLLMSERSWKHHFVTLLPTLVLLCAELARSTRNCYKRAIIIASLVLAELLMATAGKDFWPPGWRVCADYCQAYGVYAWATVILALTLVWSTHQERAVETQNRGLIPGV